MKTIEFERKVQHFCAEWNMFSEGETVLCAVSGGLDSMALLKFLCEKAKELDIHVCVAHFNHQLRGAHADKDAAFVEDYCKKHELSFYLGSQDVQSEAQKKKQSLEEVARVLRYEFLEKIAIDIGASKIATAHHANDNAETVLYHLVRGTALRGLTGIPPIREKIIRPFLTVTRMDIEEYGAQNQIAYVQDESNFNVKFSRNLIRHEVIPILETINPNLAENIVGTVQSLRQDDTYLMEKAKELFDTAKIEDDVISIQKLILNQTSPAIAGRVIGMIGKFFAIGLSRVHIEQALLLVEKASSSKKLMFPKGLCVEVRFDEIVFYIQGKNLRPLEQKTLALSGVTELGAVKLSCHLIEYTAKLRKKPNCLYVCAENLEKIWCRSREVGDEIRLPNQNRKTIKKWMIEKKIPRMQREYMTVLLKDESVVAVFGIGTDEKFAPIVGQKAYEISMEML